MKKLIVFIFMGLLFLIQLFMLSSQKVKAENYDNSSTVEVQKKYPVSFAEIIEVLNEIGSDDVKPLVILNPSVDSLEIGDIYVEQGVTIIEENEYTVQISGIVDSLKCGTYMITYTVEDAGGNITIATRYVIISEPTPTFILGNATTSLEVGDLFTDGACKVILAVKEYECNIKDNNLNNGVPGLYNITYAYTFNGREYTHIRYIFVYDESGKPTLYFRKEEDVEYL